MKKIRFIIEDCQKLIILELPFTTGAKCKIVYEFKISEIKIKTEKSDARVVILNDISQGKHKKDYGDVVLLWENEAQAFRMKNYLEELIRVQIADNSSKLDAFLKACLEIKEN